ncbi:uncharacterized protein V1518DRAFT_34665 [Limtongia smithiae]|uniref:uncharacterized protein n=1 Tax=Limtongia smithiae TaxID=1125753 RepID=UPI0034CFFAA8
MITLTSPFSLFFVFLVYVTYSRTGVICIGIVYLYMLFFLLRLGMSTDMCVVVLHLLRRTDFATKCSVYGFRRVVGYSLLVAL